MLELNEPHVGLHRVVLADVLSLPFQTITDGSSRVIIMLLNSRASCLLVGKFWLHRYWLKTLHWPFDDHLLHLAVEQTPQPHPQSQFRSRLTPQHGK